MKKIIILIIFLLLFLGGNNYQELNSIAIITNIAIEKDKDNYKVTFQEVIPTKDTVFQLEKVLKNDLDNFNIILSESNPKKILEYSNNYKYVNSLIKDNITLRSIKKAKLEHKEIKLPIIKIDNNRLVFYKYKMIGDDSNE